MRRLAFIELGLVRAIPGSRVEWQCERDHFCRLVLEKHWPQTKRFARFRALGNAVVPQVSEVVGKVVRQLLGVA